jgi:hypothetical protein
MDVLGTPTPARDRAAGVDHDERSVHGSVDEKLGIPILDAASIGFGTWL